MSSASISKDFTKGNIFRQLILLSLPFMASNALQVLYSTIDMIIVGHYVGTEGLSAVSQSSLVINLGVMVCLGFANAGQVLIAQALGAKKHKEINDIIGTLFTYISCVALVFTAIFVILPDVILYAIDIPAESAAMAKDYLVISGIGMIFTAGYNMVSAVLRGMGDARRPFIFILIASVANLVLDLLLTRDLGFGVAGAAWATILGQAIAFIASIIYLYKRKESFGFDFKLGSFKPNRRYASMITSLGAPMAIQSGAINLSMIAVNAMINGIGVVASASFGVGCRIDDIVNKISQGIQYASMPMISQNLGANEKRRAKEIVYKTWIISGVLTVVFMSLYLAFGEQLFMLFSEDTSVHEMAPVFISAIIWMFPAFSIMRGTGAFVQGIGNAKLGMVLAMLDGVVLRIGLSWLFGIVLELGFFGFVLGYGLAPYGYAIPSLIYFLRGKWEKKAALAEKI